MPLEHPYQFNGLSLQDQSKRDYGVAPPVFALANPAAPEELRAAPARTLPAYGGPLVADVSLGLSYFPEFDVTVIDAGRHWNNGRVEYPTGDIGHGTLDVTGPLSGGIQDYQQAANYAAAADTTIAIACSDLGLVPGRSYRVFYSYRLNAGLTSAHTPRIGLHTATLGGTATPMLNTTEAMPATDFLGLSEANSGHGYVTLFTTDAETITFRAFHVGAAPAGAYLDLKQIYFFGNTIDGRRRQEFYTGQYDVAARPTVAKYVSDTTATGWIGTADVWEDGQITDTPDVSEGTMQEYWYWERAPDGTENVIDRRQILISARTTDNAFLAEAGSVGLKIDGGPMLGNQSQSGPMDVTTGWMFYFLGAVIDVPMGYPSYSSPAEPNVDLYMYSPAGSPAGTKIHTELVAFGKPPLDAPHPAITSNPACGTTQGPENADIDGLVYWNIQVEYEILADVKIQYQIAEVPGWNTLTYLGGGLWETGTAVAFDAVADAGTWTIELRAVYLGYASEEYAPSLSDSTCSVTVAAGVAPSDPVLDCPNGPIATGTHTFSWTGSADHYTYSLDGATPVLTTALSVTLTGLAAGTHTLDLIGYSAGNLPTATQTCTFVVDTSSILPFGAATPRDGCGITDNSWGVLDGDGWWVRVKRVDGIWDADVRDERYPKPSQSGERSVNDFYGGKPITVTAEVRGLHLANLREGQRAVQLAFGDLGVHRFYFKSKIDDSYYFVCARKIQPIDFPEEQTDQGWKRPFTVALRGDDPRAYSLVLHHQVLTIGLVAAGSSGGHFRTYDILSGDNLGGTENIHYRAYDQPTTPRSRIYGTPGLGGGGGSTAILTNAGTAETYPISVIHGPISGGLTYANLTTGEQLVWLEGLSLGATDTLVVDHGYDEITRNNGSLLDYTDFDALHSEFWPLEPGANEIVALPYASGDGASIDIYWRDALR